MGIIVFWLLYLIGYIISYTLYLSTYQNFKQL